MSVDVRFGGIGGYGAGDGPAAVVVLHEWDGLVPHIRDVTDRVAALGFTAFAPDLYDGASAPWGDTAEAERLQRQVLRDPEGEAARIGRVVSELRERGHSKVATLGFCTGGALSILTSALYPVDATVAYYGIFARRGERNIANPVLVHVAEHEEHNPPASPEQFPTWFAGMPNVAVHIYPGTRHAFFNDTYPDCYDAAAARLSWDRTTSFFREHLHS
ncbi:MAG TPA: dienelactone hydrolase family protein [Acidimicrobiales bacterium]|nr:dienelactone hydrolase family protein [Acidimicrobiales bacterium]